MWKKIIKKFRYTVQRKKKIKDRKREKSIVTKRRISDRFEIKRRRLKTREAGSETVKIVSNNVGAISNNTQVIYIYNMYI